jgi:hypothetical protein
MIFEFWLAAASSVISDAYMRDTALQRKLAFHLSTASRYSWAFVTDLTDREFCISRRTGPAYESVRSLARSALEARAKHGIVALFEHIYVASRCKAGALFACSSVPINIHSCILSITPIQTNFHRVYNQHM